MNASDNEAADNTADQQKTPDVEPVKAKTPIKNIAVFGLSFSDSGGIDTDRSDMNLIVSVDQDDNRICIASILRDSNQRCLQIRRSCSGNQDSEPELPYGHFRLCNR